jgi:hypothetical protein
MEREIKLYPSVRADDDEIIFAPAVLFSPIAAILIAVFVLEADFHSTLRPILVVRTSAVAISVRAVIVGRHSPISTYRAAVPVHIAAHLFSHPPHIVLAHAPHTVAIALLRSPIATDSNVLAAVPVLLARLLRLLGAALWLHRDSLGLTGRQRLSLILGE